ncbi:MAG: hypothetical protein ABI462_09490, partial [Ignavibacteria bacterium]
KIAKIQKFGKFRLITDKDPGKNKSVRFSPSKKLSMKVNSNFDNLKKVKVKFGKENKHPQKTKVTKAPEKKIAGDVDVKKERDIPVEAAVEITDNSVQRKLISDDLVNLHKEITKEEAKPADKNNLWG